MNNLKNKRVLVMGLGLHGGGLATTLWLAKMGALVTVTDLKTKEQLKSSLDKIPAAIKSRVNFVLGENREDDFRENDIIIQNPAVPRDSKYLKIARAAGAIIENDASLFFKSCPSPIIGVTGTRGKSTTATLIYEFLKYGRRQIFLAGLPQKPELGILPKVKKDDLAVLELSSWQLEVIGAQHISPSVAVITNVFPDHLNRYRGMADYTAAKKNIFLYQHLNNFAILNYDNEITRRLGSDVRGVRLWFSKKNLPEQNGCFVIGGKIIFRLNGKETVMAQQKDVKLLGLHNLENVLAAMAVAGIYQISPVAIKKVLVNFNGLPNRLEFIREIKRVKYINDTTATTPDGTMAALSALGGRKNIILIAGGSSKNIPNDKYLQLAKLAKKSVKAIVLFAGQGSDQFLSQLKKNGFKDLIYDVKTMAQALILAKKFAFAGDIILLSPACASFGLFVNEFERGEQFRVLVKKM